MGMASESREYWAAKDARSAPATPAAPAFDYATELRKIRAGEEEKYQAGVSKQKEEIESAYTAGLMTPEQKQAMETQAFEATRAQYGGAAREFTEGAYGNVNIGALREGIAGLKGQEASAVGRIGMDITMEEARRKTDAAEKKRAAYATLFAQTEYPRTELPTEGLSRRELIRASGGDAPVQDYANMNTPGARAYQAAGYDPRKMKGYSYNAERGWYIGPRRNVRTTTPKAYNSGGRTYDPFYRPGGAKTTYSASRGIPSMQTAMEYFKTRFG